VVASGQVTDQQLLTIRLFEALNIPFLNDVEVLSLVALSDDELVF